MRRGGEETALQPCLDGHKRLLSKHDFALNEVSGGEEAAAAAKRAPHSQARGGGGELVKVCRLLVRRQRRKERCYLFQQWRLGHGRQQGDQRCVQQAYFVF